MRRFISIVVALLMPVYAASAFALERNEVLGSYELQGVMEMAGRLVLKSDQTYVAGFSYGAADWMEEGSWRIEGTTVVLSGGKFRAKNYEEISLLLPSGSKLAFQDGKLALTVMGRQWIFLDPNKSKSSEGKMRIKGKVAKVESDQMVLDVKGECMTFFIPDLPEKIVKNAERSVGKSIELEVPYSAIRAAGSCL